MYVINISESHRQNRQSTFEVVSDCAKRKLVRQTDRSRECKKAVTTKTKKSIKRRSSRFKVNAIKEWIYEQKFNRMTLNWIKLPLVKWKKSREIQLQQTNTKHPRAKQYNTYAASHPFTYTVCLYLKFVFVIISNKLNQLFGPLCVRCFVQPTNQPIQRHIVSGQ